jgi:hypothetical protein
MSDWRQVYEAAVSERNAEILTRLIHEVEHREGVRPRLPYDRTSAGGRV